MFAMKRMANITALIARSCIRWADVQKIINVIILVLLLLFVIFAVVQTYRLERYRREFEQLRTELECARNRESDIRATVRRFTDRTGTLLSESVGTVAELRKQLKEVRAAFEDLESYCDNIDSDCGD